MAPYRRWVNHRRLFSQAQKSGLVLANMLWEERVAERDRICLGAVALDQALRVVCASDGVLEQSGMTREELVGRPAIDLLHPDESERGKAVLQEVQSIPGKRPGGLYRLRLRDGGYEHFTVHATNLQAEGEQMILLDFTSPTERDRAQAIADDAVDAMRMLSLDITLEQSLDWVAGVAERHVPDLQIVTTLLSSQGPNHVTSRRAIPKKLLQANLAARPDTLPIHVDMALHEWKLGPWRSSRKVASPDFILPGRLTTILAGSDGDIVGYVEALRSTIEPPDDAEWLVHGMISRMMTAVFQRHEFDQELRRAADLDSLTGLVNRRKLFELLNDDAHLPGSLLYLIDLDRFSWVNNNLGHQAGDETLKGVARALLEVCPTESLVSRLGGDEFVVWVPTDQASLDLEALGAKISEALVVPAGIGDKRVWVRASIGMVRVEVGESGADAVNRADVAMYASKRGGGDAFTAG